MSKDKVFITIGLTKEQHKHLVKDAENNVSVNNRLKEIINADMNKK